MRRFIEILALLFVDLLSFNSEDSTGGAIAQDVINQTFTELTDSSANYTMVALTGRQSNTTPSSRVSSHNKHHRAYITSEIIYNNAVHALCCAAVESVTIVINPLSSVFIFRNIRI